MNETRATTSLSAEAAVCDQSRLWYLELRVLLTNHTAYWLHSGRIRNMCAVVCCRAEAGEMGMGMGSCYCAQSWNSPQFSGDNSSIKSRLPELLHQANSVSMIFV
jgi:hypothetical protein